MGKYYVFENVVNTAALDRNGKKFQYSRTARVNKESSLRDLYTQIQELSNGYLVHRFFVQDCKIFWANFCTKYSGSILTMDYSENIKLKPKWEAQSAHFSGGQHSLHC